MQADPCAWRWGVTCTRSAVMVTEGNNLKKLTSDGRGLQFHSLQVGTPVP